MKKRIMAMLLVLTLALCTLPICALAADSRESTPITPNTTTLYYINADSVNLRSGPGTSYSSGGQVNKNDTLILSPVDGTFVYYGDGYKWYRVTMTSGQCSGRCGYVVWTYVSSKQVSSLD